MLPVGGECNQVAQVKERRAIRATANRRQFGDALHIEPNDGGMLAAGQIHFVLRFRDACSIGQRPDRQDHADRRATPQFAIGFDTSAVQLGDMFDDR
jgi:hypothetical protein